jgi:hypothetical protein
VALFVASLTYSVLFTVAVIRQVRLTSAKLAPNPNALEGRVAKATTDLALRDGIGTRLIPIRAVVAATA